MLIFVTLLYYLLQIVRCAALFPYTDFRNIYTGAVMGFRHTGVPMYLLAYQFHIQHLFIPQIVSQEWLLPFLTPPFVALLLSPLALLPAQNAYIVWGICNIILLLILSIFLTKVFQSVRWQIRYLIIGMTLTFIPVWEALIQGQLSFILLLSLFFGWYLIRSKKEFLGGFVSSLLVIKPHFVFLLLVFFLLKKRSAFFGLVIGLLLLFIISITFVGIQGLQNYGALLLSIGSWEESYGMHPQLENTWGGLLYAYMHTKAYHTIILPWIIGAGSVLMLFLLSLRKKHVFDLQWSLMIFTMIFIGPHVFTYDVGLLLLSGFAISNYCFHHPVSGKIKRVLSVTLIAGYFIIMIDYAFLRIHLFIHLTVWFILFCILFLVWVIKKEHSGA